MRRLIKQKRGQFIVIAAMMVAIMIVSIGAVMYGAVTYFKYERWEEYLAIVDNVKSASSRLVEMSLANYTLTLNDKTLKNNLDQWRNNITKAYYGFGVILTYSNATLARHWNDTTSFSGGNATFILNITSVGLVGYEFTALAFLRVSILDVVWSTSTKDLIVRLTVEEEGLTPLTNLGKSNFQVEISGYDFPDFTLDRYYSATHFLYEIRCASISKQPEGVAVTVVDNRCVKAVANSGVTRVLYVPAVIGYRSDTGTNGMLSPKVRIWNGTAWSTENELPSAGSPVRFVRVAYCPVAARYYEKILVTLSDDGYLDAYVWNDTAWVVTNDIGFTGQLTPGQRRFDIEYEKTSGEALLVYSITGGKDMIGYKVWNGSSWSEENIYEVTAVGGLGENVYWAALAQKPLSGSNEIALLTVDDKLAVYGVVWNGSLFSSQLKLGSARWEYGYVFECIAVAYESISGYATFVWADNGYSYSMQWNGSAWDSSPKQINLNGGATDDVWLSLKADPVSDKLMLLGIDNTWDLNTAYWNGSSWTVTLDHDIDVDTPALRCADLEWEPNGSKVLMVWGTSNAKLSYKTWTSSGGWSSEGTILAAGTHWWVQLRRNSLSTGATKILGARLDSNLDLGSLKFDGTTLTGTAGAFTTNTNTFYFECFEIEYQKFGSQP